MAFFNVATERRGFPPLPTIKPLHGLIVVGASMRQAQFVEKLRFSTNC
jgi:hypothetical protein